MSILLVSGYAEHGKDHFANFLESAPSLDEIKDNYDIYIKNEESYDKFLLMLELNLSVGSSRNAFANRLKDEVCEILNIDRSTIDSLKSSNLDKEYEFKVINVTNPTYRDVLVDHGLHMRSICDDYWIIWCVKALDYKKLCVITDVRFENEVYHDVYPTNRCLVRIHRDYINVADKTKISEHSIDHITPEILLINKGGILPSEHFECKNMIKV